MFQKRLPAILSSFTKTLSQLDALVESNKTAVVKNDGKINELITENDELTKESISANQIADNLRKLIGGK